MSGRRSFGLVGTIGNPPDRDPVRPVASAIRELEDSQFVNLARSVADSQRSRRWGVFFYQWGGLVVLVGLLGIAFMVGRTF